MKRCILISIYSLIVLGGTAQNNYYLNKIDYLGLNERNTIVYANKYNEKTVLAITDIHSFYDIGYLEQDNFYSVKKIENISNFNILEDVTGIDSSRFLVVGYDHLEKSTISKNYIFSLEDISIIDSMYYEVSDSIDYFRPIDVLKVDSFYYILAKHFSRKGDSYVYTSIHKVSSNGKPIWVKYESWGQLSPMNIHLIDKGKIAYSMLHEFGRRFSEETFIVKQLSTSSGEELSSWESELIPYFRPEHIFFSKQVEDGNIILSSGQKSKYRNNVQSILKISPVGDTIWDYHWDTSYFSLFEKHSHRTYKDAVLARNGDYIIAGVSTDTLRTDSGTFDLRYFNHITRLSPEGEEIFSRFYSWRDDGFSYFIGSTFVHENEDGSIFVSGGVGYSKGSSGSDIERSYLLLVDSNGCIDPENCGKENLVSTEDLLIPSRHYKELQVFPNPTENVINFSGKVNISRAMIVDLLGKQISLSGKKIGNDIDVSHLANGKYIILLEDTEGDFYRGSFIKQ